MKKIIYILLFLCLIFNTNNYQELNRLAIITNIGIDYSNNNYTLIYQEVIPSKKDGKIINNYKYHISKDKDLEKAFSEMKRIIPKTIYFGHLENVLIKGPNKEYIYNLDKYINKDIDNYKIIITSNSLEKVFKYGDYKYINTIIKNNISYQDIKKNKLEKKTSKIPVVKFIDKVLLFDKYEELGEDNE